MADPDNNIEKGPQLEDWRRISWSSIFLGTVVALSLSVMLHVLGLGVTASSVDTNTHASEALSRIGGVTGVWFLASTAISLFVGGFIASTLAHTFTGKRAAIYGIAVWSLSTLLTMSVVVPALVKGAGNAITTAGSVVDRAGALLGNAGSAALQGGQNAPSGLLDSLQRSLIGTPSGQADQAAVGDVARLLAQRFTQGEWTAQQHDQLVNDVAKVASIPSEDARRRVDEVQSTISSTLEQAQVKLRQAAEATRQAIATAAYSAFAAMLVGLLFALFGAHYGELDEERLPTFARIRFRGNRQPVPYPPTND
jgi:hypothetical protein